MFHPACGPSDAEVAQVLGTIRRRPGRLLRRLGLESGENETGREDPLAEASPALAGILGASVQGRVALGALAGARVRRLGEGQRQARDGVGGPRHAHLDGFDLHANVWVGAHDRARLEQLCRYVLRPLDVLRCPSCAGRMQLIAPIEVEDPAIIQRILAHLRLPGPRDGPQPPCSKTEAGAEQPALLGVTV